MLFNQSIFETKI